MTTEDAMDTMDIKNILKALTAAGGVSGCEDDIANTALGFLKEYCPDAKMINGNVIGTFGGKRSDDKKVKKILIDAHLDQVGLIVTEITEKGFIRADSVGGIDARLLPAQRVEIFGKEKISGTVCCIPPHLTKENEVVPVSKTLIDTGYSKEELEKIVSLGDIIRYEPVFHELSGDYISATALDDRCGIAAILYALSLCGTPLEKEICVMFSTKEEIGGMGAKTGCFETAPDIAIEVDVSFSKTHDDKKNGTGDSRKGPMIGISPSLSREITKSLISAAEKNNISYQREVMSGLTSTNADEFAVSGAGVKTCTVSVPIRYMHTPCEVVSLDDIRLTGEVLAAWLKEI